MATWGEVVDRVMRGDFDDATPEERAEAVQTLIQTGAVAASAVTIQPIPFVDSLLIAPIQIGMVQAIARVYGHRLDRQAVLEMLSTFGASIVAQNVMIAAAKFVPFFGWVVTISMAYALTWAIGEVSDHYFRAGRGVDPGELRSMFKDVYTSKRAEKESEHRADSSLKSRLDQLRAAFEAGLIDEEEFRATKEQILRDF
jgi:uncharacterized protein (DUF697 family)